ncbi:MAG TPA: hypothetical protein VFU89_08345 [Rhabdochlamydiaceae bacterium]|nr:hypothetical protein [Rhabdochlamydiaceae bacterium]
MANSLYLWEEQIDAHIEIAEADPYHDFSPAKKCAAKSERVTDFENFCKEYTAKEKPSDYDSDHDKQTFLCLEIAANRDLQMQETLIKKIRNAEQRYGRHPATEDAVDHTVESDNHSRPLTETLAVMISQNPCPEMIQNAKAFAQSIKCLFDRVRAHIAIASIDTQHDFSLAEKHAFSVLESDTSQFEKEPKSRESNDVYLGLIAEAKALFDLPSAKVLADTIMDPSIKELSYLRIVDIEAQTDIGAAKKTRDTNIKDPNMIDYATRYIAISLAKKDLTAGKAMAASIKDEHHQKQALSAIAQLEAGQ